VTLPEPCDLVTIDVGWTRQRNILPAAARLLGPNGRIITLVKPHYEAEPSQLQGGVLPDALVESALERVSRFIAEMELVVVDRCDSPIRGQAGNREVLLVLSSKATFL
jgi:23S rRNA (cytidine1920-2'-O)/16S rRNA (cytidine1409-2'-O)-methyltransferase